MLSRRDMLKAGLALPLVGSLSEATSPPPAEQVQAKLWYFYLELDPKNPQVRLPKQFTDPDPPGEYQVVGVCCLGDGTLLVETWASYIQPGTNLMGQCARRRVATLPSHPECDQGDLVDLQTLEVVDWVCQVRDRSYLHIHRERGEVVAIAYHHTTNHHTVKLYDFTRLPPSGSPSVGCDIMQELWPEFKQYEPAPAAEVAVDVPFAGHIDLH